VNCPESFSRSRSRGAARSVAVALALAAVLAGCGKKGPPLAPLVSVPARIESLVARRSGNTILVQFTVPDKNQDGSTPADCSRLEVYGFTGDPGSTANFLKNGTPVASLPVRRPPPPEEQPRPASPRGAAGAQPAKSTRARPEAVRSDEGFDQGATVIITEALTPELAMPVVVQETKPPRIAAEPPAVAPPLGPPPAGGLLGRVYVVVGVNRRGQKGAPSIRVSVPVHESPMPPVAPAVTYTEDRLVLSWSPPAIVRRPAQGPNLEGLLPSVPRVEVTPASAFNVYDVTPPAAPAPGAAIPPSAPKLPHPINEKPIATAPFEDLRLVFGTERCYVVRTVDTFGAAQVESESSAPACVTPRDTFAPAAPSALQAVASHGAVSLIWDANTERDLAGYLVLRGVAPGGTFERLTAEPIRETTFRDTTAKPGVRYAYAVVAVDNATPPNISARSNTVEETAR
jgi:hypothetical protein